MANRFPLQDGDRIPDYIAQQHDGDKDADRRGGVEDNLTPKGNLYDPDETYNPIQPEQGSNAAAVGGTPRAGGPLYRPGTPASSDFLTAPFAATPSPEGCETEVREIDMCKYGDGYDPKTPFRVREVGSEWNVDTDYDGVKN